MKECIIAKKLNNYDAEKLEKIIRKANKAYWDENNPVISDTLYDRVVERLRELNPNSPILQELGHEPPEGDTLDIDDVAAIPAADRLGSAVRHQRSMLSLDKCYDDEGLNKWAKRIECEFLVMPKMDGIACSLRYDINGELYLGATRGNGTEGEDITVNVEHVKDIPQNLKSAERFDGPMNFEVRGELYMRLSVFEEFSEQYSNPRNLTAGAVKHKDVKRSKKYKLSFYAYDIIGTGFLNERQKMRLLNKLGFKSPEAQFVESADLAQAYGELAKKRSSLDYEIDGVVFRVSDCTMQESMGATGHHPRHSIAYKFQGDSGQTTHSDVLWSVSRTGVITPVAIFEAIELSGASITKASLHNLNRFEALGLTEGCTIEVSRRGGVIPQVESVVSPGPKGGNEFKIPTVCPACDGGVIRRRKRDGEFLYCKNPETCIQATLGALEHFAKVVDIQGFGPKLIAQAFDAGLLKAPADYFTLTADSLTELERMGTKGARKLISEVDKAKKIPLATFLRSLGIEQLGNRSSKLLANEFLTLKKVRKVSKSKLMKLPGIKDAIADAIVSGLEESSGQIDALLEHVKVKKVKPEDVAPKEPIEGPLNGKSFLFTGTLEGFTRKDAQSNVTTGGGINASGVNKNLNYLVVGKGKGAVSSKQKKAEKLIADGVDIKIISEDDFLAMVG